MFDNDGAWECITEGIGFVCGPRRERAETEACVVMRCFSTPVNERDFLVQVHRRCVPVQVNWVLHPCTSQWELHPCTSHWVLHPCTSQ